MNDDRSIKVHCTEPMRAELEALVMREAFEIGTRLFNGRVREQELVVTKRQHELLLIILNELRQAGT